MGALTHNGEVLQGLPANASQINFDNTGTNLNSTQTENAIKEVNTKANTNATAINGLVSGLASKAKMLHIIVPLAKTDVNGFLGHILGTIIEEQEIGTYIVDGLWEDHDYYVGIVYKCNSDTAFGIIEYGVYGAGVQNMALYTACYKVGVYSNYRSVQYQF